MTRYYDRNSCKRGDDLTVTDGDRIMAIHYHSEDADPDVFGDGGAYSIHVHDIFGGETFDEGLLSGYETPREVVDEYLGGDPVGQSFYLVLSDVAPDCESLDELKEWLEWHEDVNLDKVFAKYYG